LYKKELWIKLENIVGMKQRYYITNTEKIIIIIYRIGTYSDFILLVYSIVISESVMTSCSICKPIRRQGVKINRS
jgi:hypothetical protein